MEMERSETSRKTGVSQNTACKIPIIKTVAFLGWSHMPDLAVDVGEHKELSIASIAKVSMVTKYKNRQDYELNNEVNDSHSCDDLELPNQIQRWPCQRIR